MKPTTDMSRSTWIVRGILVAILLALGVVAIKEFGARRQAAASHSAVADRIENEGETNPVLKSHVKALIQGSPEVETVDPKSLNSPLIASAERYTWKGLVRNYSLTIGYSLGNDPEVELVDGSK